jgi:CubicO group peptidase (beta-lactamase class C family)
VLACAGIGVIGSLTLGAGASDSALDWSAVDALFAEYDRSGSPGCALGVVRDGVLEYGRGYGMANLDHGIAITPQTVFRTASVSKQFTAAAVAIAAQEGSISLDDPVRKWITDLPRYPVDPTIRQMVHHTSGLRDYLTLMSLRGLRDDDYYTSAEVRTAITRQRELNFTPGSDFLYSNAGYFMLGEVIREATGVTLKEYAQAKVFGPLGMTHSHYHDDHNHIVSNRATGYAPTEDGYRISVTTLDMIGDGGVFTSVEDLAHWVDALNQDRIGPGLKPVLESTRPLTTGDPNPYAFGQRVGEYRGVPTVSHGGAFVGYRASITRFPEQGLSIVLACNRADATPSRMALRIADIVLADELGPVEPTPLSGGTTDGDEAPVPGPVDEPGQYVGRYYSFELDVDYRLSVEDGALRLRIGRGVDVEVGQVGPDHLEVEGVQLRFERVDGRIVGFEVDAGRVRNLSFERADG